MLFLFQMVWLLNSWLFASGSPVAMLQHATSSQSIVFHQLQAAPVAPITSEYNYIDFNLVYVYFISISKSLQIHHHFIFILAPTPVIPTSSSSHVSWILFF